MSPITIRSGPSQGEGGLPVAEEEVWGKEGGGVLGWCVHGMSNTDL